MSKPKYRKGEKITSLSELANAEFIYHNNKVQCAEWFGFWRLKDAIAHIENGHLFHAREKEEKVMYYCPECKKFSDSTKSTSEWQGERERGGYVSYETCPHCGSDEIEKAGECRSCGVWIPSDKDYCHFCEEKIDAVMRSAFEQLERTAQVDADILSMMAEWIEKQ